LQEQQQPLKMMMTFLFLTLTSMPFKVESAPLYRILDVQKQKHPIRALHGFFHESERKIFESGASFNDIFSLSMSMSMDYTGSATTPPTPTPSTRENEEELSGSKAPIFGTTAPTNAPVTSPKNDSGLKQENDSTNINDNDGSDKDILIKKNSTVGTGSMAGMIVGASMGAALLVGLLTVMNRRSRSGMKMDTSDVQSVSTASCASGMNIDVHHHDEIMDGSTNIVTPV
jgi:hypothetical protein